MEDFVTFEIAKKLKEKGFREGCFGYYGYCEDVFYYNVIQNPIPSRRLTFKDFKDCQNAYPENGRYDAPTISQALKWLREEKKIHVEIDIMKAYPEAKLTYWGYNIVLIDKYEVYHFEWNSNSYEQAALAGVNYCLENLI